MKLKMTTDEAKEPYERDVLQIDAVDDGSMGTYSKAFVTIRRPDAPPVCVVVACSELRRMVERLP